MSGLFDDDTPSRRRACRRRVRSSARARCSSPIVVLVVAFFAGLASFAGIWTDRLWFTSVGYAEVFTKLLWTKVLLFLVFGLLMARRRSAANIVRRLPVPAAVPARARRSRPASTATATPSTRCARWLLIGVARRARPLRRRLRRPGSGARSCCGATACRSARNDAYFHKDIGFYVFDLPWLHYLVDFAMAVTVLALLAAAVVHYLFGGIRLQATQRPALRRGAGAALGAARRCSCWSRRVDYWLDRYDLTTDSGGLFTGIDLHRRATRCCRPRTS